MIDHGGPAGVGWGDRGVLRAGGSIQEVGLLGDYPIPERLEGEIAAAMRADLRGRQARDLGRDQLRRSRRLRQELRVRGVVHGDEPPRGRLDCRTDGQQPVILQDDRLLLAERARKSHAFVLREHNPGERVEYGVILIEGARVLRERVERPAEGGPRFAISRMRMRGRVNIGPRRVNRGRPD